MQDYYVKKAKECELAIVALQEKINRMSDQDAASLQEQLVKVKREMKNYKAAIEAALA